MKYAIAAALLFCATAAQAQMVPWQYNPNNWQNNPNNWNNNPNNWLNNPNNLNSNRAIYDGNGRHWGYAVPREDGSGINIFRDPGR